MTKARTARRIHSTRFVVQFFTYLVTIITVRKMRIFPHLDVYVVTGIQMIRDIFLGVEMFVAIFTASHDGWMDRWMVVWLLCCCLVVVVSFMI